MANTKSAAKRARQTIKRTARNRTVLTTLKSKSKTVRSATGDGKAEATVFVSELDKAVKRGVIHKNAANRRKSRLAKKAAAAKA